MVGEMIFICFGPTNNRPSKVRTVATASGGQQDKPLPVKDSAECTDVSMGTSAGMEALITAGIYMALLPMSSTYIGRLFFESR